MNAYSDEYLCNSDDVLSQDVWKVFVSLHFMIRIILDISALLQSQSNQLQVKRIFIVHIVSFR